MVGHYSPCFILEINIEVIAFDYSGIRYSEWRLVVYNIQSKRLAWIWVDAGFIEVNLCRIFAACQFDLQGRSSIGICSLDIIFAVNSYCDLLAGHYSAWFVFQIDIQVFTSYYSGICHSDFRLVVWNLESERLAGGWIYSALVEINFSGIFAAC